MKVKKICLLGLEFSGVPLSAVIAGKCPEIGVVVVQSNPDVAFQWNSGLIPATIYIPGLDDLIRKCRNKNLIFTTNEKASIKEADIIFILSESKLKTYGEGRNEMVNLSLIEAAAYLIAEHAESNKIVVETSSIPLKTAECVSNVLRYNSKPGIEFQVLSNPEFYEHGCSLRNFIFPDVVLIGCGDKPKDLAAAKQLASVYERWIVPEKIVIKQNWTVELSKICTSAMVAIALSGIYAMSAICEEHGGNTSDFLKIIKNVTGLGSMFNEITLNTGKIPFALRNLIYICKCYNLREVADFWRQIEEMLTFFKKRFFQRLVRTFNQLSYSKRVTLLGFPCCNETGLQKSSMPVFLCQLFLEEHFTVSLYGSKVNVEDVVNSMATAKCNVPLENLKKLISVHDDPYKATCKSQIAVVCGDMPEFAQLDFRRIFTEMEKPAYIFDDEVLLPHPELLKIGFEVNSIEKCLNNV